MLVASVASVTVAVLLGLVVFALALDRIVSAAVTDEVRIQAEEIADLVESGESTAMAAVAELPAQGSVVQLLSAHGTVLASSEGHAASTPMTGEHPAPGSLATVVVTGEPDEPGPHVLAVRGLTGVDANGEVLVVARSLHTHDRTVQAATGLLALLGALLVAGVLLLVRRGVDSALAPVEQIRRQVAHIDRTAADERVTVPPTGDEIAGLAGTMNAMLDRLARADAAHRRFISDASHELRSPLATIRATLETSPAAGDEEHALLAREAVRLQRLVDDLLLLARADDRGLELRRVEVDLDDLVIAEVRRLEVLLGAGRVGSRVVAGRVRGDPDRLGQVLRNLTDNAVHHTRGVVRLLMDTDGPDVVVHVDDEGPPVPEQERERVFERFVRLDGSRSRDAGGSGLGLAIVRAVTTAHGGTVVAGETEEGWCRFTLRLPREEG